MLTSDENGGPGASALKEMQNRTKIDKLMWDYVAAVDTLDGEAYSQLFTADGVFGDPVYGIITGRDGLREMIENIAASRAEREKNGEVLENMKHIISNKYLEFESENLATLHYYWETIFNSREAGTPPRLFAAGQGVDTLVIEDGSWKISKRAISF